jgi:hypothetical protein
MLFCASGALRPLAAASDATGVADVHVPSCAAYMCMCLRCCVHVVALDLLAPQEQKEAAYVNMDMSNVEKEAGNTGEASYTGGMACRGCLKCWCQTAHLAVLHVLHLVCMFGCAPVRPA